MNNTGKTGWKWKKNLEIKRDHFAKPFEKFWLLNTDSSSLLRPYSKSLPNRQYVHKANNQIKGNKPVGVGYEFSAIGLSARRPLYGVSEPSWNLPLSMRLIPFDQNRNAFTARQVNDLLDNTALPFQGSLTLNALDSNYSSPEYIADTHKQPNLVNVIRLASNRNVWKKLSEQEQKQRRQSNEDSRGTTAIYGEKYKLSQSLDWDLVVDKEEQFGVQMANGRKCIVKLCIWEDMMIRTKRGKNMKDKAFRLLRIELLDAQSGLPVFKRRMWLGVWGKRRLELKGEEIYWAFRNRFDIEHFFRFGKQRLLLDSSQTPEEQSLQNWLEVVSLSYWLLWVAKEEATHQARKWQEYDKQFKKRKQRGLNVTPSQVQQQMQTIILDFEQGPFFPKTAKKGKGRQQGSILEKRTQYPVRKKQKKKISSAQGIAQVE